MGDRDLVLWNLLGTNSGELMRLIYKQEVSDANRRSMQIKGNRNNHKRRKAPRAKCVRVARCGDSFAAYNGGRYDDGGA